MAGQDDEPLSAEDAPRDAAATAEEEEESGSESGSESSGEEGGEEAPPKIPVTVRGEGGKMAPTPHPGRRTVGRRGRAAVVVKRGGAARRRRPKWRLHVYAPRPLFPPGPSADFPPPPFLWPRRWSLASSAQAKRR